MKYVAAVNRLAGFRSDAKSHACGNEKGVFAALFQLNIHNIANIVKKR